MEEFLRIVNKAITNHDNYDNIKKDVIAASTSHIQYGISREGASTKLFMLKTSHPIERYEITVSKQIQVK